MKKEKDPDNNSKSVCDVCLAQGNIKYCRQINCIVIAKKK